MSDAAFLSARLPNQVQFFSHPACGTISIGHVLWPFVGATSRLILAAGCGWIAISYPGGGIATLAAIVSTSRVACAVICAPRCFRERFGAFGKDEHRTSEPI
jgi:hypothetical protein